MARRRTRQTTDPVDNELGAEASLEALAALTRDQVVRIAAMRSELPWVARAWRSGALEVKVLGRFDLLNPAVPEISWPSVMVLVSRPRRPGLPAKLAAVAVYLDPDGAWNTSSREQMEGEGAPVEWSQYVGDIDGPPGVINGDQAGDAGDGLPTLASVIREDRDAEPDPQHVRSWREGRRPVPPGPGVAFDRPDPPAPPTRASRVRKKKRPAPGAKSPKRSTRKRDTGAAAGPGAGSVPGPTPGTVGTGPTPELPALIRGLAESLIRALHGS